jgi:hypothetical protein
MKHHLLQYDPENRLWSRPDILPGHVFGQPEHALAFGHTDSRTPNPESGIWFQVETGGYEHEGIPYANVDSSVAASIWLPENELPATLAWCAAVRLKPSTNTL